MEHRRLPQPRRFPRYETDRQLTAVVFWDDMPARTVHGRCRVLGEGGLGATLAERLPVGEIVRLHLPPLSGLYAAVRNTRGSDHGFEFIFVGDSQRRQIRDLCAWCTKPQDS